ncbi:IclR family transcriptional regulator [Brooklawnia cerclae]|uniref:IclR family acetate operon transcriptional repressor n=1 Tax=Brooklawnia cerclae TaxID=349934 RepID=A0ABX0SL29_9ACTN|nr:IclR family acetate operon transcriptional repressor [Brooklawnia cerclae]
MTGSKRSRGERLSTAALTVRAIDLVASEPQGLTLTAVADRLGMPMSSAHSLLGQLVQEQVIMRRDLDKTYRLAPRWLVLGEGGEQRDLVRDFFDIARDASQRLEETIQLAVRTDDRVTYIAFVDSPRPVRLACRVGNQLPLHACASGKVLLAWETDDVVDEVLAEPLERLTPHTVVDPARLREHLMAVRKAGYASESEESMRGLSCVSVPVHDHTGEVVAALTASLPTPSLPCGEIERVMPVIREAALTLGRPGED